MECITEPSEIGSSGFGSSAPEEPRVPTKVIQIVETQGEGAPLIEHLEVSLTELEDWACFHGRNLIDEAPGTAETKVGDEEDFEDECIRVGTPHILRALAYILGLPPSHFGSLDQVVYEANRLEAATLPSTLVQEGGFVISPLGPGIADGPAATSCLTYFCEASSPSAPYLGPFQTLATVFLL